MVKWPYLTTVAAYTPAGLNIIHKQEVYGLSIGIESCVLECSWTLECPIDPCMAAILRYFTEFNYCILSSYMYTLYTM